MQDFVILLSLVDTGSPRFTTQMRSYDSDVTWILLEFETFSTVQNVTVLRDAKTKPILPHSLVVSKNVR